MEEERAYEQIPEEIRDAIEGLDNEWRQKIFVSLLKYGELSFSELEKKTSLGKADLSFHMKKLVNAMLIEHYYRHEIGNDRFSFYSITPFGHNFVTALIQSLTPSIMPNTETTEIDSIQIEINIRRKTLKKVVLPATTSEEQPQTIRIS